MVGLVHSTGGWVFWNTTQPLSRGARQGEEIGMGRDGVCQTGRHLLISIQIVWIEIEVQRILDVPDHLLDRPIRLPLPAGIQHGQMLRQG